jgi:hypothetical protein
MRTFLAGLAIFVSWMAFDAAIDRLLLSPLYDANASLWRPDAQTSTTLIALVSAALIVVFIKIYALFVRPKSMPAALVLGALLGLALGITTGFGSLAYMPIPAALAWAWFAAGWLKGIAAGAIMGAMILEPSAQEMPARVPLRHSRSEPHIRRARVRPQP